MMPMFVALSQTRDVFVTRPRPRTSGTAAGRTPFGRPPSSRAPRGSRSSAGARPGCRRRCAPTPGAPTRARTPGARHCTGRAGKLRGGVRVIVPAPMPRARRPKPPAGSGVTAEHPHHGVHELPRLIGFEIVEREADPDDLAVFAAVGKYRGVRIAVGQRAESVRAVIARLEQVAAYRARTSWPGPFPR
jgi:hypothetical protein